MAPETKDNLELWNKVSETDPANTKHVAQRGGFTAICAHSQIMEATRQWGPMGGRWSVTWDILTHSPADVCLVAVELRHPDGAVLHAGCAPWFSGTKLDADACKKAVTDGTTKCLSLLGFNADVFLGKFDDNKYVEKQSKKAAEAKKEETGDDPLTTEDKTDIANAAKSRAKELKSTDIAGDAKLMKSDVLEQLGFSKAKPPIRADLAGILASLKVYGNA